LLVKFFEGDPLPDPQLFCSKPGRRTSKNLLALSLFAKIKTGATEARRLEGDRKRDHDGPIRAFERWQEVLADCIQLEQEFFFHKALDWANRRFWIRFWKSTSVKVAFGVFGGALGAFYSRGFLDERCSAIADWLRRLM
jgi:hypothetical protein